MTTAVRSGDPAAFVAAVREAVAHGERLHLNVGERACEIEGPVAQGVLALLDAVASGATIDLTELPADLTTGQAADILGVSRPTVISLIDKGVLGASRIGSHRRLKTSEVFAYREQARHDRGTALDEVVAISDELGLYDAD
jgi:excisionase family DNA binding protein